MKLDDLLEGATQDMEYRQRAFNIFKKINNELKSNGLANFENVMVKKFGSSEVLPLIRIGIYEDLKLYIHDKEFSPMDGVGAAYSSDNRSIHLFMDTSTEVNIVTQFGRMQTEVVHELIHYLDDLRTIDKEMRGSVNLSLEDYYNHSKEYNAYYQEAINKFENIIRNIDHEENVEKFKKMYGYDFEKFQGFFFRTLLDKQFSTYMNDVTKKKLKKRLYLYWKEFVNAEKEEAK